MNSDTATRIGALEKDAVVAQAGYTADVYEYPHPLEPSDLFNADDADTDALHTRSAIYKMVCLQTGCPFAADDGPVTIRPDVIVAMTEIYNRVIDKAYALVDQHWRAILRVTKYLERHGEISDEATLDNLIEGVE